MRDEGGLGPGGCRVGRRADGVQDTYCRVYPPGDGLDERKGGKGCQE